MTEFDSKKKLKEAKIDYTWYNQQIEQKLPLTLKPQLILYAHNLRKLMELSVLLVLRLSLM